MELKTHVAGPTVCLDLQETDTSIHRFTSPATTFVKSKVETQFSYRCRHLKVFRSSTHRSAQVFKIRDPVQSSEGNEALLALAFVLGHASFLPICRR